MTDPEVTIVNSTSDVIHEIKFRIIDVDDMDNEQSLFSRLPVPVGSRITIPLGQSPLANPTHLLRLDPLAGLMAVGCDIFECHYRGDHVAVSDGDVITLVDDAANPKLSTDDIRQVRLAIINQREMRRPVFLNEFTESGQPCPRYAEELQAFWSPLAAKLARSCGEKLRIVYFGASFDQSFAHWYELYQPIVPSGELHELHRCLSDPFEIDLYWRALDCVSNDGYMTYTVRYKLSLYPDDRKSTIQGWVAENFTGYGDNEEFEVVLYGPFSPPSVALNGVHAKFRELILQQASVDSTCHVVDTVAQHESWLNIDWSSVEILLFSNRWDPRLSAIEDTQAAKTLLLSNKRIANQACLDDHALNNIMSFVTGKRSAFRLHQQSVMGSQYTSEEITHTSIDEIPKTSAQKALASYAAGVAGIGRPIDFYDWAQEHVRHEVGDDYVFAQCQAGKDFADQRDSMERTFLGGATDDFPLVFRF